MASTDRDVLLVLYRSTDGPNWRNNTNWGTDAALSDWYGVTANDEGRVLELELFENNLRGICRLTILLSCDILHLSQEMKSVTESDPLMKLQVVQEATTFSLMYIPVLRAQSTPEYPLYVKPRQYQQAVRTMLQQ